MNSRLYLVGAVVLCLALIGIFFFIPGSDEDTGETPKGLPPPAENQPNPSLTPGTPGSRPP